jgi:predicted DNA-binding protein (MmcQ/YjbR family)
VPIHDDEIRATVEQVHRLVAAQRPQWADLPVTPLPDEVEGTDHVLKCDPDLAAGLRARYAAVTPGYHLNKRHWNTVALDGSVPDEELLELIDHSYELVVARLSRAERKGLAT